MDEACLAMSKKYIHVHVEIAKKHSLKINAVGRNLQKKNSVNDCGRWNARTGERSEKH